MSDQYQSKEPNGTQISAAFCVSGVNMIQVLK